MVDIVHSGLKGGRSDFSWVSRRPYLSLGTLTSLCRIESGVADRGAREGPAGVAGRVESSDSTNSSTSFRADVGIWYQIW